MLDFHKWRCLHDRLLDVNQKGDKVLRYLPAKNANFHLSLLQQLHHLRGKKGNLCILDLHMSERKLKIMETEKFGL